MYTIRDLPKTERPRERLQSLGVSSLSLQELLQIIIGQGSSNGSVEEITRNITLNFRSLAVLFNASLEDLLAVPGVGLSKACQIKAALELGKRMQLEVNLPKSGSVLNSFNAFQLAQKYLQHKKKEHLLLFSLDVRGRLICEPEVLSVGTLDGSLIHPREVFGSAISNRAARILLAHNHPSGESQPSDADIAVTNQVYQAGKIIGIPLIDHIVLGAVDYVSISERNPEAFELGPT